MALAPMLLDLIACPRCHGKLREEADGQRVACVACHVLYPIRDSIPHLVLDEAIDSKSGEKTSSIAEGQKAVRFREKPSQSAPRSFYLEYGTCKVVGRPPNDPNRTMVMHIDMPLVLDESTKGLVHQYIRKQYSQLEGKDVATSELGRFRRTSDVVLDDSSVSRVHAMFFFDGHTVGVLDLVSKNGTFVNGQEVESRVLKIGDVVEIGDTKIVFEG
ncbi:MAG: hypothetical protein COV45_07545 [Deltaproteobacteria bacterium CG11_big_fil_rev_8_21_14_0_20_47_16]|nr:MAG: hypothetical protein COV45_07545 [Deltaproteobacteria bacterium CG11_big_fil_rev_8_21_14_0_20_47_16]